MTANGNPAADPAVAAVTDEIGGYLDRIRPLFKPGVRITLLVRHPSHPDGSRDLLMTDDTIDAIFAAMRQAARMD